MCITWLVLSLGLNVVSLTVGGYFIYRKGGFPWAKTKIKKFLRKVFKLKIKVNKKVYTIDKLNPGDIVFVGDSLTANIDWATLLDSKIVKNAGIEGNKTKDILYRLDDILVANPKKLFVMMGVNDIGVGESSKHIVNNFKGLIDNVRSKSPQTNIYIQSTLPCCSELMAVNPKNKNRKNFNFAELNNTLIKLCKDNLVVYIDLYHVFADQVNHMHYKYTDDGIHLNATGYSLWSQAVNYYVNE